jgi:integrase
MKMGVDHVVPLSTQAAEVFRRARALRVDDSDLVFPSTMTESALSDMALLELVKGMKLPITVHGFRSSFRDWAAEETDVADAVAEASLAHAVPGKTRAAYLRTDFFKKRRELMQQWADYCIPPVKPAPASSEQRTQTPPPKGSVLPLTFLA